jgi:hypothetical protein
MGALRKTLNLKLESSPRPYATSAISVTKDLQTGFINTIGLIPRPLRARKLRPVHSSKFLLGPLT